MVAMVFLYKFPSVFDLTKLNVIVKYDSMDVPGLDYILDNAVWTIMVPQKWLPWKPNFHIFSRINTN